MLGTNNNKAKEKRSGENGIRNMIKGGVAHLKIALIPFLPSSFLLGVLLVITDHF